MLTLLAAFLSAIAKHWREAAIVVALAAGALFLHSWRKSRADAATLAAMLNAAQQQIDSAAAQEKQTDAQLSQQLAQIADLKQRVQSPQQAAAAILQSLPPLPAPVSITMPLAKDVGKSSSPAPQTNEPQSVRTQVPGPIDPNGSNSAPALAPATATIPQQDLKPLYDYMEDCRAAAADRDAARKDLADEQTKVTALTAQRDAALAAAKGGKFWTRVRRNAKWLAIGAATGAIAALAARR
ncbi:MAG: hypothetical protein ACLP1Y_12830 [Candidatus Acidiferrales bacterium]